MNRGHRLLIGFAAFCALWGASVKAADHVALDGRIHLPNGQFAEGVIVSAKRQGSTITVSVASNDQGYYAFPRTRLPPGLYSLDIRAVGYDLAESMSPDVTTQDTVHADLKLRNVDHIETQLSNAEWLMSAPGTERDKSSTLLCVDCHTYQRIFMSTYNADTLPLVVERMGGYSPGTMPGQSQLRPDTIAGHPERFKDIAQYLSSVNLSSGLRNYGLQTLPRPRGRATHMIVTEYQLPRAESQPHDVIVDKEGAAWYVDFGRQYLGKLDPKTGNVKEYQVPITKPGFPLGLLDLEFDEDGNPWVGMMMQAAIGKFDRRTEKFSVYTMPQDEANENNLQIGMVEPRHMHVDGKVWMVVSARSGFDGMQRLDVRTGEFERFDVYASMRGGSASPGGGGEGEVPGRNMYAGPAHGTYGIATDSRNNVYFADFANDAVSMIGRLDAHTRKLDWFRIPTSYARPRRLFMDSKDQLWIAEFRANKIAMFDTRSEHFQEWDIPEGNYPYYVVGDRNGEAWSGSEFNDRILRLNPGTKETTEYLLPHSTNIRRVFVDNSTTPVTIWIGNNHAASIVKVEPLD